MITLTIDGKQVTVEEGATIFKAAEKLDIEIPTFCYHDKLEPVGSCRMCLVEVEKMGKLQAACATPVAEGMVVKTDTPQVKAARKGVLEFLLINHPLDCPVCDKGGECELQNLVFKYGSDKSRYVEEKRRFVVDPKSKYDDLTVGPQIVRNMNRCILCRKCVRFITEIAGETDLGTFRRGAKTEINTLPDIPVDNPYSGNVIEICPVGALTSKSFRYKTRVWQLKATPSSICPLCGDGCNIKLWTKDDKIYRITSRRNDLVDEGFLCDKGRFGFINRPDRLKHPLVRKNGELLPADWDEAIKLVASKFKTTKEQSGAGSLAGVGSSRFTNEDCYLFEKFFRVVLGTNNIDHRINSKHLLPSPTLKANQQAYTMTNSISDIEKAKLIFVLGCDLQTEHPIIGLRVIKSTRKGNVLFLANPESTRLNRFAQDELLYKKGTELDLLYGVIREIIEEEPITAEFRELFEDELKELRQKVQPFESQKVSQTTGIPADNIKSLANTLAKVESIIILCGKEINSHPQNIEIINTLYDLLRLTGHQNKNGCGVNLLREDCNSQGAIDCGVLPDRLPGYLDVSDEVSRKKVEEIWKAEIPKNPGFDFNLLLEAAHQRKIKAMYIAGADPVSEYPERDYVKDALKKLDFLVVQDIFLTQTAKLADVILPGASFAEKDGTFTNVERRVQKLKKAFDPLANCRADWYIICMLAQAMGYDFEYTSPRQIFEELACVSPIHAKMNREDFGKMGKRWEIEEGK